MDIRSRSSKKNDLVIIHPFKHTPHATPHTVHTFNPMAKHDERGNSKKREDRWRDNITHVTHWYSHAFSNLWQMGPSGRGRGRGRRRRGLARVSSLGVRVGGEGDGQNKVSTKHIQAEKRGPEWNYEIKLERDVKQGKRVQQGRWT